MIQKYVVATILVMTVFISAVPVSNANEESMNTAEQSSLLAKLHYQIDNLVLKYKSFLEQLNGSQNNSANALTFANQDQSALFASAVYTDLPWFAKKKGAARAYRAGWYPDGADPRLADSVEMQNPHWYYTWSLERIPGIDSDIPFVPMISTYTEKDCNNTWFYGGTDNALTVLRDNMIGGKFEHLLLFNEPNTPHNKCVSVADGIEFIETYEEELKSLTNSIVTPAATGGASIFDGRVKWNEEFLMDPSVAGTVEHLAVHYYPDPVARGYIPSSADPLNPQDPFYSNEAAVNRAVEQLAADFLNRMHLAHRRYDLPIWITEFGVADWGAKGNCVTDINTPENCPVGNDTLPDSRVSPEFVSKFMARVLPELQERSYILRYAWFPAHDAWGEMLKASALFKYGPGFVNGETDPIEMTPLGEQYANYQYQSLCSKGEWLNTNGMYTEFKRKECGEPSGAGWSLHEGSGQYRRSLTPEEAGVREGVGKNGCYHGFFKRYWKEDGSVVEWITERCPDAGPHLLQEGWRTHQTGGRYSQYRRVLNPNIDKISSMLIYF